MEQDEMAFAEPLVEGCRSAESTELSTRVLGRLRSEQTRQEGKEVASELVSARLTRYRLDAMMQESVH